MAAKRPVGGTGASIARRLTAGSVKVAARPRLAALDGLKPERQMSRDEHERSHFKRRS